MYNDPRYVFNLVEKGLNADCFWWPRHVAIFTAIFSLAKQRVGIDSITVRAEMEKLGTKDSATVAEIDNLATWVPARGNVLHYAKIVVVAARWRNRQAKACQILEAADKRDDDAWEAAVAVFAPSEDDTAATVLTTTDQNGEIIKTERRCPGCEQLEEQVKGAEKDIRAWRTRYAKLEKNRDEEARKNPFWLPAQLLFEHWKRLTGHKRSEFTTDRFELVEPFLRSSTYGFEMCERAIAGIANQHSSEIRKNGTLEHFDGWETVFKGAGSVERYASRAKLPWKSTLKPSLLTVEEPEPATAKSQLHMVT